jgi:hypothetical protein
MAKTKASRTPTQRAERMKDLPKVRFEELSEAGVYLFPEGQIVAFDEAHIKCVTDARTRTGKSPIRVLSREPIWLTKISSNTEISRGEVQNLADTYGFETDF